MSKTLSQKKQMCEEIKDILKNNNCCLFIQHDTITGEEFSNFRKMMHKNEAKVFGIKKTVLEKALPNQFKELTNHPGSILIVACNDPLKIINTMKKATRLFQGFTIHSSLMDSSLISIETFQELAKYKTLDDINGTLLTYLQLPSRLLIDILDQTSQTQSE